MPGPPVARIRFRSGWCMRWLPSSTEGSSIQPMMSAGAPAATAASSTSLAAAQVDRRARGWGLKMIPLRVFRQISALKMAVEVGLVVGTMPQISPTGSAMVVVPKTVSRAITPQVRSSL